MNRPFYEDDLDPRKGKEIPVSKVYDIIGSKATVRRMLRKTPEVMVKITSNAKDMKALKRMVDYIARLDSASANSGKEVLEIEDEQGNVFIGPDAREDALSTWQGIPKSDGSRREAFHIVFTMPEGTPPHPVREAVKELAEVEFQRFQYLFTRHDDTPQPHVHLVVNANPIRGKRRLSPGRKDLQRWRETFAENLRGHGVEANATPRAARLVTTYSVSSAQLHKQKREAAGTEINNRRKANVVNVDAMKGRLKAVYTAYMGMAKELSEGNSDDRKLSADIMQWLSSLGREQSVERGTERAL